MWRRYAVFERQVLVGWGDMDLNGHMRNTAYLDKAVDVRMLYFAAHGFPMSEFMRLRIGPIAMRDEAEYYREARLLDELRVTVALAGLAEDGSRFVVRNEFYHADGRLAARISTTSAWLDLANRRLISPPTELLEVLQATPKTDDFRQLPASAKG